MTTNWKFLEIFCLFAVIVQNLTVATEPNEECITPNKEKGLCVKLENCPLHQLITEQISKDDINLLRNSKCYQSGKQVWLCCPQRHIESTNNQFISQNNSESVVEDSQTKVAINSDSELVKTKDVSLQCGDYLGDRMYGGNITFINDSPWTALIEYTKDGYIKEHLCSGALISNRYVLTAAHCTVGGRIESEWSLTGVRLGEWNTYTNPDCDDEAYAVDNCADPHRDIGVEEIITHPQYVNDDRQLHDIALLRLNTIVSYTKYIQPICLPSSLELRTKNLVGSSMKITGWGGSDTITLNRLKMLNYLNGTEREQCRSISSPGIDLDESQICASSNSGLCVGTSGGPLTILEYSNSSRLQKLHYFLAGVQSFGDMKCGHSNQFVVYTRVGAYIDWIENTMRD